MTAQQLKNSILQMAVQGKLVPQDPNDEPASVLLERIRAEKEQLIKQKKIKREKNPSIIFKGADNTPYEKIGNGDPVSIADEVPFDIPETWEWVRLCHLGCFSSGKTPSMSDKALWGTDTMWVTSKDMKSEIISSSEIMLSEKGAASLKKYPAGTLLMVARSGILRRLLPICTLGIESTINQDIKAFELFDTSLSELIFYFLKGQELEILRDYVKSVTTVESLKFDEFQNMLFPLPPKEEQIRILTKIHELRPLWEAYEKAENERISQNEEFPARLKKSILQQAVQGKLVPQNPADEPASILMERIHKEKEKLIKSGKIKRDKHKSVIFRRDNSHYEKLDGIERCIDDEIPFEIPTTWSWCRLGNILDIARGGSPRPIKAYITDSPDGVNWIKIGDTDKGGKYIYSTKEKIIKEGVSKSRMVYSGDFLLTNSMSFGRPYILKTDGCIHDGWLVLSNPYGAFVVDYLYYLLSSPFAYYQFCDSVSGAVVKNLNSEKVAEALFPVPPIEEQMRIATYIEEILPIIEVK